MQNHSNHHPSEASIPKQLQLPNKTKKLIYIIYIVRSGMFTRGFLVNPVLTQIVLLGCPTLLAVVQVCYGLCLPSLCLVQPRSPLDATCVTILLLVLSSRVNLDVRTESFAILICLLFSNQAMQSRGHPGHHKVRTLSVHSLHMAQRCLSRQLTGLGFPIWVQWRSLSALVPNFEHENFTHLGLQNSLLLHLCFIHCLLSLIIFQMQEGIGSDIPLMSDHVAVFFVSLIKFQG